MTTLHTAPVPEGRGGGIGFRPDEIRTTEPTRSARLKWVVVVDRNAPRGHAANAVACVAASTAVAVAGLVGPGGPDAESSHHPGLPWAGCSVLGADQGALRRVRAQAALRDDVAVVDMPVLAQSVRVYDEYLTRLEGLTADDVDYVAVSLVGPRKHVDRIVGGLALLS